MTKQVKYSRASYPETDTNITSLVLAAEIDDEEITSVGRIGNEWFVFIPTKTNVINIPIEVAKEIIQEFSNFINSYDDEEEKEEEDIPE